MLSERYALAVAHAVMIGFGEGKEGGQVSAHV